MPPDDVDGGRLDVAHMTGRYRDAIAQYGAAIAQGDEFLADPLGMIFTRGGFTYWGGLIGGILCVVAWLKWRGYPLRAAVDSCAIAIPVG